MPYRSERQRRFMHAAHPEIAKRWDAKYGGRVYKRKRRKKHGEQGSPATESGALRKRK